ncbi:MAG: PAS domain-containing protein [Anaerolineales bacterium]|nr:MAG: PAS domain-containing protein [Anaerolineales bacterium]
MSSSVRSKILGAVTLVLLIMLSHQLLNMYVTRVVEGRAARATQRDVQAANLLAEAAGQFQLVHSNALLHVAADSVPDMQRYESQLGGAASELDTLLDALQGSYATPAELDELAGFRHAWSTYRRMLSEELIPASSERKAEARLLIQQGQAVGLAAQDALDRLAGLQEISTEAFHSRLAQASTQRSRLLTTFTVLTLAAAAVSLWLGLYLASRISQPVNSLLNAARLVADGDLDWSVTVKTGDEIEDMAESLTQMTRHAKRARAARQETIEKLERQSEEMKQLARLLAAEQHRVALILQMVKDGVIVTDAEGKIVVMNQATAQLTGWSREQVVGKRLDEVLHTVDDTTGIRQLDPVRVTLQTGRTVHFADHTLLVASDGTERPIIHTAAPVRDQENEIVGAVLVLRETSVREPIA